MMFFLDITHITKRVTEGKGFQFVCGMDILAF